MPKRRYRFFQIGFFILLILMGLTVWRNYDYWVFKLLIADNYIFADALDIVYSQSIGADNVKGYHRDFDRMVMAVVTDRLRAAANDRYTYLYTPKGYKISKSSEKEDAKKAYYEEVNSATALLYLPNISKLTRRFVYENKEALNEYDNLILDLRGNYGGLLNDFYRIAELFIEKGGTLGYERTRLPFLSHEVKAKKDVYFNFENILIFQDGYTASAAEGLILALKQNVENVALMGDITFGKGVGQVTIPLTGGYAARATVLLVEGPDGESIHRAGIAPDIYSDEREKIAEIMGLISGEDAY